MGDSGTTLCMCGIGMCECVYGRMLLWMVHVYVCVGRGGSWVYRCLRLSEVVGSVCVTCRCMCVSMCVFRCVCVCVCVFFLGGGTYACVGSVRK